jgi:hypothetical protein
MGVFSFTASGTGCNSATLNVKIDYPAGSLTGLQPRKYGPSAANAAPSWFTYGTISGDSVTYSVKDNDVGDNDLTAGQIKDPFALVLPAAAPAPGGVASIPTLSEWGVILLSLMTLGMGMVRVRRRSWSN